MYQYVFALSHGCDIFYYRDWIDKEGVAICSCNDGIRPVIFKIERTDEESKLDYTPVRQFFNSYYYVYVYIKYQMYINKYIKYYI